MYFDYNKYRTFFTADFETSTDQWGVDRARVWLWDICDKNLKHYNGNNIQTFIDFISKYDKCLFSFHNLSYDGCYLLYYLLENGYTYNENERLWPKQFTTIITPQNLHYAYQICFENGNIVTINDSLKHNSQSVDTLAKTYKLPIKKGHIDYDKYRPVNYEPTEEEIDYIHNDTEIVMRVLLEDISKGFIKFTESGNSRKFFKLSHCKEYNTLFPELTDNEDNFVRQAYKGGYCYLKPTHFNEDLGDMISLDINSMYPAMMLHRPLPYGEGEWAEGYAEDSAYYKLKSKTTHIVYIQHMACSFKLKPNKVPIIQRKAFRLSSTKALYISSSENKILELWLTNVDLKLLFECYYVWDIEYIDCIMYKSVSGVELDSNAAHGLTVDEIIENDGKGSLYYDYLLPWRKQKEHSTGGERDRAKKMQNVAYGSQASSKNGDLVKPILLPNGMLTFQRYGSTPRKGGYIPLSCFITAYSREFLITNILNNYERFVYCDTDSLYLIGHDIPNMPIHPTLYGYFKIEHIIDRARFLGSKRYIYHTTENSADPNKTIIRCCGAPPSVVNYMNFDNFRPYDGDKQGLFDGKIIGKIVVGGKHLIITTYKLIC